MNKKLLSFSTFVFVVCFSLSIFAQTAGTMTFTVTTNSSSGYSPKHGIIIWLENSAGTFIKTKLKQSKTSNLDHFATWTAKSGSNTVDAVTGNTLLTHGTRTIVWDGTDVAGNIVADGVYKVWVEYAWASSKTTGKLTTSFSWTKGLSADHQTPANFTSGTTGYLNNMTIDWVPTISSVETVSENTEINVFPNPSTGIINVNFDEATSITVENILGSVVYNEKLNNSGSRNMSIDLTGYANGIYVVNVINGDKSSKHKVLIYR
ncbi:MAG: hypothetical protein A2033_08400 [Bacteroidetes bacterium GWA2_31_9]|nr:MAG: hypothetical protein A2033_08400 [Bacteroidetes bacterium GWA2_31_9]